MRRLIVNADDFGLTRGVNRAIIEAHERGMVTSATLMANSRAFDEAVELASKAPRLSVGCHVMLVDGSPILNASKVSSLIVNGPRLARSGASATAHNANLEAEFRSGFGALASCALRRRLSAEEIEAEATAQIKKLQGAGIRVSHLDTHKHTHILFSVLKPLLRAARACGVRAIRNPFVPLRPLALAHLVRRPHLWKRYSGLRVLRRGAEKFRRLVEAEGMVTPDGTFGMVVTGALDERLFQAILGSIPPGTWEFVCHPGYNDAELGGVRTRLRESRVQELQLLTSAGGREILNRNGVELISYREI
ncbi:MAG TPA: ChbG/HpnK family deacetylase [Terriglobales bacterium]|nr:ChbG/HpnK family deacetylase [Terriglobales bacterium]